MEKSSKQRRSAEEWRKLIAESQESHLTAAEFATSRGIRPKTFAWWKWRLKMKSSDTRGHAKVELVRAEVIDDIEIEATAHDLRWELETSRGHRVKVSGASAFDALIVAIEALGLSDGAA